MGNDPDGILILPSIQNFNPRSRVGNDRRCTVSQQQGIISIHVPAWGTTVGRYSTKAKAIFQSTFPRGERHSATIPMIVGMAFQSTFPRGERPVGNSLLLLSFGISIHVPAWGTTANFNNFSPILLYRYYKSAFYITPSF